jgi:hypothetical protein
VKEVINLYPAAQGDTPSRGRPRIESVVSNVFSMPEPPSLRQLFA